MVIMTGGGQIMQHDQCVIKTVNLQNVNEYALSGFGPEEGIRVIYKVIDSRHITYKRFEVKTSFIAKQGKIMFSVITNTLRKCIQSRYKVYMMME